MNEELRFPVGKFEANIKITGEMRKNFIKTIEELPEQLNEAVKDLNDNQLETPYRQDGWTIKQVVHHVADSHSQSFSRFKMALTENIPTIKPYQENLWAELADSKHAPIELSLKLIEAVHGRWVLLLNSMSDDDFGRMMNHPERGISSLENTLGLYDWHSRHHLAHITELKKRMNW